ncbi:16S rRNA (cytidine1402-2'-O)-methyltransferase [Alkalihalobacillus xiaoxiensis]|uniref:Ribosomal RNA small subunit methyltransferase I n=1 Tax=Shouchella xiaoxiensis TaxID=766895 RepID=A0ABS2T1F7_9BACI|nr:16S rRNA (cytidine(1402)-2'-O)-methyltransferase [Shouchella xiaoxiensis]MBM7841091.1 16S rRNA (cytidine1402-2'-O)-methyltransferase [Shouchella xiaoxiensis]
MIEQKSYAGESGMLYLVPTPIGNLEDMTFRAIRILKEADWIAAEDTRQTKKLTTHFDVHTPLISYHEHNKQVSGEELVTKLKQGATIALVSDAGTPGISDPGEDLAKLCIAEKIKVIALPGANAALTTLVASGLSAKQFTFVGFLPRNKKDRKEELERVEPAKETLIFYEAPHRLNQTLQALYDVLGDRQIVIGRELTKKFEEFQRGTISESLNWVKTGTIKGEFCICVEGKSGASVEEDGWWTALTEVQHINHYVTLGLAQKEAIKQAAKDRGVPKRELYQSYHLGET